MKKILYGDDDERRLLLLLCFVCLVSLRNILYITVCIVFFYFICNVNVITLERIDLFKL